MRVTISALLFTAALAAVLWSCGGCATHRSWLSRVQQVRHEIGASLSLSVHCSDGNEYLGRAVALGPRYAVTASHVVRCQDIAHPVQVMVSRDGMEPIEVVVDAVLVGADAARLVVAGKGSFDEWASLSLAPASIGDTVCSVSGMHITVRKCGDVVDADSDQFKASFRTIPGDSGSPVYNSYGEVVGIIIAGPHPMANQFEHYGIASSVSAWKELVIFEAPDLMDG